MVNADVMYIVRCRGYAQNALSQNVLWDTRNSILKEILETLILKQRKTVLNYRKLAGVNFFVEARAEVPVARPVSPRLTHPSRLSQRLLCPLHRDHLIQPSHSGLMASPSLM